MRNQKIIRSLVLAFFATLLVLNLGVVGWAGTQIGSFANATALLDTLGSTRGSFVHRGASGWEIKAPSATVGQAVVSGGTGADLGFATFAATDLAGNPDAVPASPDAFDDEFNGSSLDGKWATTSTPSGWSATVANGALAITQTAGATFGFISQAPGSTFTITAKCEPVFGTMTTAPYPGCGLMVRDSVGGKLYTFLIGIQGGSAFRFQVNKYTGFDSNANYSSSPMDVSAQWFDHKLYLRVRQDASNLYFEYSNGGQVFGTVFSEAKTAWLGNATDQVGPFVMCNTTACKGAFDWIRRQ